MTNYNLIIDPEFRDLLPPLTAREYEGLTKSILTDGIREPIRLWNGIIVDGHNRYMIAKSHTPQIPFTTVDVNFGSRDEVIVWMIDNQIARRNLPDVARIELAERATACLERIAAAKMVEAAVLGKDAGVLGGRPRNDGDVTRVEAAKQAASLPEVESIVSVLNTPVGGGCPITPEKVLPRIDVRAEQARIANVSPVTIHRFRIVRANNPDAIERIREGKATITGEFNKLQKAAEKEEERNRAEVRAMSLDVDSLGLTVVKGLFSSSDITGGAIAIVRYARGLEVIQKKVAQVLLSSGALIILTNHTDIERAVNVPLSSFAFRGDTVLNIGGDITHALVFSRNPQNVPQYIEGTHDDVMMKLIDAFAGLKGDTVVFPTGGIEKVAFIAADMQRKAVVFDAGMPKEFAITLQRIRDGQ